MWYNKVMNETILISILFALANSGTSDFDRLKKEVDKCILVCANCHGEIHAGLVDINKYI